MVTNKAIRSFLKTQLNRSFRKASSRPHKMDTKLNRILGKSFAFEVVCLINSQKYILNIDEISVSYKTSFNYSWLPKEGWSWVKNINFEGSKTTIAAIVSTERFFAATSKATNNTSKFCEYLEGLNKWIKFECKILMDE